jgi:hypothetical protein
MDILGSVTSTDTTKGHQLVLAIVVLANLASFAALPPMVPVMVTASSARRTRLSVRHLLKNRKMLLLWIS